MARIDPRDDPRYQRLRGSSAQTDRASQAADRLAAKVGNSKIGEKHRGCAEAQELLDACGGDSAKAARVYEDTCRRAGMSTGVIGLAKRVLFNR